MVRGDTARRDVEGRGRERHRPGIRLHEQRVRDAPVRKDAAARGEHLARRVEADRRSEKRRDPTEGVADAGAHVDDALPAVRPRERDEAIEILAGRMRGTRDVRRGGPSELALDVLHLKQLRTS